MIYEFGKEREHQGHAGLSFHTYVELKEILLLVFLEMLGAKSKLEILSVKLDSAHKTSETLESYDGWRVPKRIIYEPHLTSECSFIWLITNWWLSNNVLKDHKFRGKLFIDR